MSESVNPSGSCLVRMVWFLIGPAALFILAVLILERGGGWLTRLDILYFAFLFVTVAARGLDFYFGNPLTASGTPATTAHLARYAPGVLLLGLAVWVAANLIGNR